MNWYKTCQQQFGTNVLPNLQEIQGSIMITGSDSDKTFNLAGKTISTREMIDQALSLISPDIKGKINKIIVGNIPQDQAIGLAVSTESGTVHLDVSKIYKNLTQNLPSTVQTDGMTSDPDLIRSLIAEFADQIVDTISHESTHRGQFHDIEQQYIQGIQQGKMPTSPLTYQGDLEGPAYSKGHEMGKRYLPRITEYVSRKFQQ